MDKQHSPLWNEWFYGGEPERLGYVKGDPMYDDAALDEVIERGRREYREEWVEYLEESALYF